MTHDNKIIGKKSGNATLYSRLFLYYRVYTKLIFTALIGLCLFSLVDAGMIYFVKPLIDQGLGKADSHTIQLGALLVVGIFFLRGLASFTSILPISAVKSHIESANRHLRNYCAYQEVILTKTIVAALFQK